ncbi:midA-like protein [Syncephalis plumigaleata]|nr:midA-like protein [Syncephalis plumigaleata]
MTRRLTTLVVNVYRSCSLYSRSATPLTRQLQSQIKATGPLSVAQFMRQALTHPQHGYYMKRDVFGKQGDFITSPEVIQMFGELLGIWLIAQWQQQMHQISQTTQGIRLIELGPGRGTLMSDILRISKRFPKFRQAIKGVHLVEVSPELQKIQRERLCIPSSIQPVHGDEHIPVYWHDTFIDWSKTYLYSHEQPWIIAHELFDALPIQMFEKTTRGWREILVDVDHSTTSQLHFRFVLAPGTTLHSQLFTSGAQYAKLPVGSRIEVSSEGWQLATNLARTVTERQGQALIIDYGNDFNKPNSLRGIRNHKFYDPLSQPGETDLSVDVDFSQLRQAAHDLANIHGPVTQRDFLHRMGIEIRLAMLQKGANVEDQQLLQKAYQRLTDPLAMGNTYKLMAFTPKSLPSTSIAFE